MKVKIWLVTIVVVAMVSLGYVTRAFAAEIDRRIDVEQARKLAQISLGQKAQSLPGLDIEQMPDANFPEFVFFIVTWGDSRSGTGGTVEQLAIDVRTADVWSGTVCRKVDSPQLRMRQKAIRKAIGLNEDDYKKIKRPGPYC